MGETGFLAELQSRLVVAETWMENQNEAQIGWKLEQLTKDLDNVAGEVYRMRKWLGVTSPRPRSSGQRELTQEQKDRIAKNYREALAKPGDFQGTVELVD